jgi:hypothetical protein
VEVPNNRDRGHDHDHCQSYHLGELVHWKDHWNVLDHHSRDSQCRQSLFGQDRHSQDSQCRQSSFGQDHHWLNYLCHLKRGAVDHPSMDVGGRLLKGAADRRSMQSLPGQCRQLLVHDADLGVGYYLCSWEMPC